MPRRLGCVGFFGELSVRDEQLAHPDKGPHDLDADDDGATASQHRLEHGHALLGERVGQVLAVPPAAAL
jgi:hypothetical protein